ncbi:uracil-DNA glycosylase [Leeuwenhoekiella sp. MAR_2009_132]|uniref:uracil-DNA glycosylase n=1 Tax=Leeuwenhoekiella sp. MAR_2009_132 TaxID=1392489 RepID=UPI00048C51D6|nr:uracil-DNA glycosylase [Leeuwenhoekiella sp. MAR_2009_132]
MNVDIHPSWKAVLNPEFEKTYFKSLIDFVKQEYGQHKCYPPGAAIFKAFDLCPFEEVKVVILGQDPYHGVGQAHGLCFSVPEGIAVPPSLINIFKEIATDLNNPIPQSGNLERWAKQGVLLLNATLTVRAHLAGSHQKQGWETFTDHVISVLSQQRQGIVFLLWGGYARKKAKKIDTSKHLVLESGHPSPLSANRGFWFGNRHFSKTNDYLKENDKSQINW